MLYRHKFHGLFIAGILRDTKRDEGRKDSEEILRMREMQSKPSEVLCVLAQRKRKVPQFLLSVSLLLSLLV